MSSRRSLKRVGINTTVPKYLLDAIDELANECDTTRSNVVEALLTYCIEHHEIIDELFPYEEEGETEEEPEEELEGD